MQTFETVEQLLLHARDIHRHAAGFYHALKRHCNDPRSAMLAADMYEHEKRMEKVFNQFIASAPRGVLHTYLQYNAANGISDFPEALAAKGGLSLADISTLGQQMHGKLVEILELAVRESGSETVRTFLADLLQLESSEQRAFTQSTMEAYQL